MFAAVVVLGVFGILWLMNGSNNNQAQFPTVPTLAPTSAVPTPGASDTTSVTPAVTLPPPINSQTTDSKAQKAVITTSKGEIELKLYPDDTPNTVKNFVAKAKSGYYNNLTFHRVENWVIQGGDPKGDGTGGGSMATELNSKPFVVGALGVARGKDIKISNDSQFFIVKTDATWLNNQYTNFGQVTKGMEVVNKIEVGDKILQISIE